MHDRVRPERTSKQGAGRFRPEIAGLRAVAVASVVLCHLDISPFKGGFVGVDIFFVISGYLITRIILTDIEQRRFSFADFYIRRARRILPALVFVAIATYLCGALWLAPELFRNLAKETTHALLSISNIQYWRESKEYFAATAAQLPLLHCWSLSLEEQFYLVWPALLVFSARIGRTATIIMLAAIVSFAASLIQLRSDPQAAFFLMPYRIFEFSIGALVIFAEQRFRLPRMAAESLTMAGLTALLVPIVAFDSTMPFPGVAALLPSLGTAAIIWAGARSTTSRLLANPPARAIGAISYSLYLCHWPMIFFANYIFGPESMTGSATALLVAAMVAVSIGMNRLIERPFRQTGATPDTRVRKRTALRYTATIAVLVAVTHLTFLQQGLPWRLSAEQQRTNARQQFGMMPCEYRNSPHCVFGATDGPIGIELVGDSLAHQYVSAFEPLLIRLQMRGEISTVGGCPMLVGMLPNDDRLDLCRKTQAAVLARLASSNVNILFAQAWDIYNDRAVTSDFARPDLPSGDERTVAQIEASLNKTFELLATGDRRILLLGYQVFTSCPIDRTRLLPGPLWHAPQTPCDPESRTAKLRNGEQFNAMVRRVQAKWPDHVRLLFPAEAFCDDTCPIFQEGAALYIDSGHFSVAGAQYMGQRAEATFLSLLNR